MGFSHEIDFIFRDGGGGEGLGEVPGHGWVVGEETHQGLEGGVEVSVVGGGGGWTGAGGVELGPVFAVGGGGVGGL